MAGENKVKILVEAEDQASSKLKSIGSSFSSLAKIAVGAIGAISITQGIKSSIQAMNDQVRVNTQLEAVLRSTNNAVGLSSQAIQDMASKLQGLTTFSDDTIQAGQNMLLTFTNIGSEVFPKATETLLDMATAMNGGVTPSAEALSSQAIQLGKALNDPINGISSLSRVGVTFTEGQKTMIEGMVKAGDTMSAQKIILAELNREFGGSAQAQAQTFAGKMAQLGNAVGDIAEIIGFALLPALTSIANKLKIVALQAIQFFNDNSQAIMQFANDIQVFFESIIMTIIGNIVSTANTIMDFFSSIFGNSQKTAMGMGEIFSYAMKVMSMGFQSLALISNLSFKAILFSVSWVLNKIRGGVTDVVSFFGQVVTGWMLLIEGIVNIVIGGINIVMRALGKSTYDLASFGRDAFASFTAEISAQNEDVTQAMQDNWKNVGDGMSKDIDSAVSNMTTTMSGFNTKVVGTTISLKGLALDGSMGMDKLTGATGKSKDAMKELAQQAQKIVTDITEKVSVSRKAVDEAREAIEKKTNEWLKYKQEGVKALSDVNNEIRKLKAEAGNIDMKFKVSLDDKLSQRYVEIKKDIKEYEDGIALWQAGRSDGSGLNDSKYKENLQEIQLIQNGISKDVLDNASAYEKMLPAEKMILDIQKEKNLAIEENKKKIESLIEKQTLLQMQADQKSIKDLKINTDLKDGLITASYTDELGKKQEIHDYENVQIALQISEKQKAFSDEMDTLQSNLQTKLSLETNNLKELKEAYAIHNAYLDSSTKDTAKRMTLYLSGVAQSLREVIALRREAGFGDAPVSSAPVGARAVGGAVASNKPYLVGENGPELFVPNSAGRIEPNKGNNSPSIVINFGGVQISSDIDLDAFSERLKKDIARSIELSNLGIS